MQNYALYKNGGNSTTVQAPFLISPLTTIDVGTSPEQRIGGSITLQALQVKLGFTSIYTINDPMYVRVSILRVDPYMVQPINMTQIYAMGNGAVSSYNCCLAPLRTQVGDLSIIQHVYHDKVYRVSRGISTSQDYRYINIFQKLHNKKFEYGSTSSGDKDDIFIFVSAFSPAGANLAQLGTVQFVTKTWFKDG